MLLEQIQETIRQLNLQYPAQEDLFKYVAGNTEWQNLGDYLDDTDLDWSERFKYFMPLWYDREHIINDHSATVGYVYFGEMILSVRSKMTEKDYNFKYETHIKRLYELSEKTKDILSDCGEEDWSIKAWKEIQVIDEFDTNVDGLKIIFRVQVDF